jgi:hypothetical protein
MPDKALYIPPSFSIKTGVLLHSYYDYPLLFSPYSAKNRDTIIRVCVRVPFGQGLFS